MTATAGEIEVGVIVVSWNTKNLLRTCLASIRDMLALPCEVIVVDNASTDGSPEMVEAEFPSVRLIRSDRNLGFGAANNIGAGCTTKDKIALMIGTSGAMRVVFEGEPPQPQAGASVPALQRRTPGAGGARRGRRARCGGRPRRAPSALIS